MDRSSKAIQIKKRIKIIIKKINKNKKWGQNVECRIKKSTVRTVVAYKREQRTEHKKRKNRNKSKKEAKK